METVEEGESRTSGQSSVNIYAASCVIANGKQLNDIGVQFGAQYVWFLTSAS